MPARSDDPLRRCTLNLYEADCAYAEQVYGHGWTEIVRAKFHKAMIDHQKFNTKIRRLGDLPE